LRHTDTGVAGVRESGLFSLERPPKGFSKKKSDADRILSTYLKSHRDYQPKNSLVG
jgi:hypothetical protein